MCLVSLFRNTSSVLLRQPNYWGTRIYFWPMRCQSKVFWLLFLLGILCYLLAPSLPLTTPSLLLPSLTTLYPLISLPHFVFPKPDVPLFISIHFLLKLSPLCLFFLWAPRYEKHGRVPTTTTTTYPPNLSDLTICDREFQSLTKPPSYWWLRLVWMSVLRRWWEVERLRWGDGSGGVSSTQSCRKHH